MTSVHDLAHSKGIAETTAMYALLEMQNKILGLETEIKQLRVDLNEAFIAGAANERAKIVALLRDETQIMAATVQAQNTLLEAAVNIEAGRHLK